MASLDFIVFLIKHSLQLNEWTLVEIESIHLRIESVIIVIKIRVQLTKSDWRSECANVDKTIDYLWELLRFLLKMQIADNGIWFKVRVILWLIINRIKSSWFWIKLTHNRHWLPFHLNMIILNQLLFFDIRWFSSPQIRVQVVNFQLFLMSILLWE